MRVAMGDLSNEPSMEEILSSIKRIIAEEGDAAPRVRRAGRPAPVAEPESGEVLELNDPMPIERIASERVAERILPERSAAPESSRLDRAASKSREKVDDDTPKVAIPEPASHPAPTTEELRADEASISQGTVNATRGALDHLSRMIVRPEPGLDGTLEGLVRDMIRPMLREWFDANLPTLVEEMVAREIGRITGNRR